MQQQEIGAQVTQFIRKNFLFNDKKNLSEKESLIGTGVIDSTGVLELIAFLEQHFNLKFEDNELIAENFDSIEKISLFISKKLS